MGGVLNRKTHHPRKLLSLTRAAVVQWPICRICQNRNKRCAFDLESLAKSASSLSICLFVAPGEVLHCRMARRVSQEQPAALEGIRRPSLRGLSMSGLMISIGAEDSNASAA